MPDKDFDKAAAPQGPAEKLHSILLQMGRVMVACSGGVDSTYLLSSCIKHLGSGNVLAVVVQHPLLREGEAEEAVSLAREMGAEVHSIELDPRQIPDVAANTALRCYHCKKFIFTHLRELADQKRFTWILDGTNADDDQGHRPGLKALEELNVRSPLREAGMTKKMIRAMSRADGLSTWDKPPAPCLATRFPYDQGITEEDLERVKQGEAFLRGLGLEDLRLRVHGDIARIEVPDRRIAHILEGQRRQRLVAALRSLGYRYVTVDLEGLRSGSMDR